MIEHAQLAPFSPAFARTVRAKFELSTEIFQNSASVQEFLRIILYRGPFEVPFVNGYRVIYNRKKY